MRLSVEARASIAAFGVCAAAATAWMIKEELHDEEPAPQPAEFVVKSFQYDQARHIGEIMASETFTKPTSRTQAASAMTIALQDSRYEFANYFPDVPEAVRDGNINCHVIDSSKQNRHFDLFCMATPDSSQTT